MLGIKIFMPITSLIIIALLSRILGVKEFGMFITLGAYYGVFRIISIFGIDTFLTREVSCDKSNISILLGNACFIGLISSICCAIAMSLIFFCIPEYSYQIKLAAIIMAFSLLPGTLISYIDSVFIAIGKIEYSFFAVRSLILPYPTALVRRQRKRYRSSTRPRRNQSRSNRCILSALCLPSIH